MKFFTVILILLGVFIGCTSSSPFIGPTISGAVNGYIMWKQGEAHVYYHSNKDIIYRAAKRACSNLDYKIITDKPSPKEDRIVAGNNDRFKITIKAIEPKITEVSIRVDTMGDKPYAELLYNEIEEQINVIRFDSNGHPVRFIEKRRFSR